MKSMIAGLTILVVAFGCGAASFPEGAIRTDSSGVIVLEKKQDFTVFAEFQDSPVLTDRLRSALIERGVRMASTEAEASGVLRLGGSLKLSGGPRYQKTLELNLGTATQKSLDMQPQKAAHDKDVSGREVAGIVHDAALVAVGYEIGVNKFVQGISISQLVASVGKTTGVTGWLNTKIFSDPRGICMGAACKDWNKVSQLVVLNATYKAGAKESELSVRSSVFEEILATDEILYAAIDAALRSIKVE